MFEAVLTLCLGAAGAADAPANGAPPPCRDLLLPGYEAPTEAGCSAALRAAPPDRAAMAGGTPDCRPVGDALAVEEIAEGVFVHAGLVAEPDRDNRGDVANLGFVIGARQVAVIDTGSAAWMGEALWRAIRQRTDKPVTHVILTHMHPDHVFGASVLEVAGAASVAHAGLTRALADRQGNYLESLARLIGPVALLGTEPPQVVLAVEDAAEIDLGGRRLHLRAWPLAHTGTDLTVFDSATGTLFAGDLLFDRHTPALDGSVRGWLAVLDRLQREAGGEILRVVPGHGATALPWPDGAAPLRRYLDTLARDTRAAIAAGLRLSDAVPRIAASEADRWELFDAYNPRNATVAFTELEWE